MDTMTRFNAANLLMWSLFLQVNNGKAQMPAWKNVLEPEVWPTSLSTCQCAIRAHLFPLRMAHGVQHGSGI